jgi:hypothetical protein
LITLNVHQQNAVANKRMLHWRSKGLPLGLNLSASRAGFSNTVLDYDATASRPFPGISMCTSAATIVGFVTSEVTW